MSEAVSELTERERPRYQRMAPCGMVSRTECEAGLAVLLEGCRADKVAVRRVGRRNCALFQCVEERGIAYCKQCPKYGCAFHQNLERICPIGRELPQTEPSAWKLPALGSGPLARPAPNNGKASASAEAPGRTITRVRWYIAALERFQEAGVKVISSAEIGAKVGVKPAVVRRDLCYFGQFGTPSVGYEVEKMLATLLGAFAMERPRRVIWVGAERLRGDVAAIHRLAERNWRVVAVFDPDPEQAGAPVEKMVVHDLADLESVEKFGANTAVLAVGELEAQEAADRLVEAGVEAILNLAPTPISVSEGVVVQQADLTTQLMLLSYQTNFNGEVKDA